MFVHMAITYVSSSQKMEAYINKKPNVMSSKIRIWTADVVNIVELIYAFDTKKCVDNGSGTLEGLTAYIGYFFGISIKDSSNSYVYMKKRKGDSRTYFLDELSRLLNERMDREDEKASKRLK